MHSEFEWGRKEAILEDLGIDGRIILKWILKKENGRMWTELMWLRTGTIGRFF